MHRSWPETRSSLLVSGSVRFFTGLLVGMLALIAMSAGPAQAAGPPERTGGHHVSLALLDQLQIPVPESTER